MTLKSLKIGMLMEQPQTAQSGATSRNNSFHQKAVTHWDPLFETEVTFIQNCIYAWTLPQHISQSRFGGRRKPSSACTIIALAMARVYHRSGMHLPSMPMSRGTTDKHELIIPVSLLALLTNSIVDGNTIHAREMAKRQSSGKGPFLSSYDTFTIPQGIEALGGVYS
ncbi:hypothetical protein KIN20_030562 [Parelaphostrongylus tenuis]|uniref:Uncharacterized protein n=1 Tax=Parelaphostrongylus tenuis TaxID=148309 RepID=A0AAD5R478_PARTN|nr:hypothetical protein KIN20_030562 [Parelaphostrongylus tenuis]